ncbi:SDR family NAD(P)-dependent oxidoreductase [Rhodopirellula sp. SWK7]|uniref:SDR family NAD(P)-dependent oxidoreductase n=1 Tax=Rhodopirellula sp. SWK7 TaxID=595460 RepID=UPI0002BE2613|nr:glucose 1-dehydrogenase [Rhodopirellula sp. SWK7]EMI43691.1 short-chain dehydrogenase/reductase SDR [Rhodopirellula sp. SWK7]
MSKKLDGKVAIVTGASKGIGAAIAKALATEGASVVVNFASSREGADRVVSEITENKGRAVAIQADVSDQGQIQRLLTESIAEFGKLDILVNNAGIYLPSALGDITADHFHRQFNLNVLGLILVTQESLKHFPSEGGVIINTSSVVSTLSPPGTAVYNATKSAVDNLTRTFAKELAGRDIRVNSVNPGLIATEGTHAVGFVQDGVEIPAHMGRVGQPEQIATGVVFLASPDSEWMTGQTLYLTGAAF